MTAPDSPAVEPTDRSTSPEITSMVIGRAISAMGRVLPIRKETFSALPKLPTNENEQISRVSNSAPTTVSQRTAPPSRAQGEVFVLTSGMAGAPHLCGLLAKH